LIENTYTMFYNLITFDYSKDLFDINSLIVNKCKIVHS